MQPPTVFLDKDGTLIKDIPYNIDPNAMAWEDGAVEGLRLLAAAGFRLVVITNQSGVARGYFGEADLARLAVHLNQKIEEAVGTGLDGFYYCPHHPEGVVPAYAIQCDCRKPQPGLLEKAARDLGVDLTHAWMLGDILNDVEAGQRAGCRTILTDNGHETEWKPGPFREPDFTAANLEEAALTILRCEQMEEIHEP